MPPLVRNGRPGARVLATLPFLVLAAVAAANAWIGPAYGLLPLLSLGPALAAVLLSPGCTALAGGLAAVICVPLAAYARIEVSLQRREESEELVTAVLAQIPTVGPVIDILSCGHPPPLLLTAAAARFIEPADLGCPWAWPSSTQAPGGRSRSGSAQASASCSTPTGSARHATSTASSTRLSSAPLSFGGPGLDAALEGSSNARPAPTTLTELPAASHTIAY
jgi:Stage II sporulation protein E (SpoIIE)